jgi:hypothetical protein
MSLQAKLSAVGLAFAVGLSPVGFQDALARAARPSPEQVSPEYVSPEHATELYFDAARSGRVDLLDGLIKAGMNPDERDPRGFTPLILAAYNGQVQPIPVPPIPRATTP